MSVKNVEAHIDAIERKLAKSIKIAEKGESVKLGDVVKLGRKTNSIVSELKKSLAEYDVRIYLRSNTHTRAGRLQIADYIHLHRAPTPPTPRPSPSTRRWRRSSTLPRRSWPSSPRTRPASTSCASEVSLLLPLYTTRHGPEVSRPKGTWDAPFSLLFVVNTLVAPGLTNLDANRSGQEEPDQEPGGRCCLLREDAREGPRQPQGRRRRSRGSPPQGL